MICQAIASIIKLTFEGVPASTRGLIGPPTAALGSFKLTCGARRHVVSCADRENWLAAAAAAPRAGVGGMTSSAGAGGSLTTARWKTGLSGGGLMGRSEMRCVGSETVGADLGATRPSTLRNGGVNSHSSRESVERLSHLYMVGCHERASKARSVSRFGSTLSCLAGIGDRWRPSSLSLTANFFQTGDGEDGRGW